MKSAGADEKQIRDDQMKRPRGRGRRNNNNNHNNPNKHFESNGPDVRIRGSAQQILEKYLQYARDSQTSGDRIHAENYLQHAEHYLRVLAKLQPKEKPRPPQQDADKPSEDGPKDEASAKSEDNPRGQRKPRRDDAGDQGSDGLKVIDDDKPAASSGDAAEAKPRRRRTYKKRETSDADATEAAPIEDGVMKTLSRGRKKPAAKPEAASDGDTPAEAAE